MAASEEMDLDLDLHWNMNPVWKIEKMNAAKDFYMKQWMEKGRALVKADMALNEWPQEEIDALVSGDDFFLVRKRDLKGPSMDDRLIDFFVGAAAALFFVFYGFGIWYLVHQKNPAAGSSCEEAGISIYKLVYGVVVYWGCRLGCLYYIFLFTWDRGDSEDPPVFSKEDAPFVKLFFYAACWVVDLAMTIWSGIVVYPPAGNPQTCHDLRVMGIYVWSNIFFVSYAVCIGVLVLPVAYMLDEIGQKSLKKGTSTTVDNIDDINISSSSKSSSGISSNSSDEASNPIKPPPCSPNAPKPLSPLYVATEAIRNSVGKSAKPFIYDNKEVINVISPGHNQV